MELEALFPTSIKLCFGQLGLGQAVCHQKGPMVMVTTSLLPEIPQATESLEC